MRLFFSIIAKDLLLLRRDRAALLLLFCMPAVLALIITLVQQNVFETTQNGTMRGILVNQDSDILAPLLEEQLDVRSAIVLTRWKGSLEDAMTELEAGAYQFCILIPAGTRVALERVARQALDDAQPAAPAVKDNTADGGSDGTEVRPELMVYVDPVLGRGFRMALQSALEQVILGLELRLKLEAAVASFKQSPAFIAGSAGEAFLQEFDALPELAAPQPELMSVHLTTARRAGFTVLPTATQQTLPAMAVFGMFFIIVPLAGALIRERQSGVFMRLAVAPVWTPGLLGARLTAYALICLCQFGLIVMVGWTFLPWLGGAVLIIGAQWPAVLVIVLCVALAACGVGLLLGILCRTVEQAAAIGPIAVVIAAAIGGIMVPVFVMPPAMQTLSRFSPLEWGHRALLDVLVRGADLYEIWPRLFLLLLLFTVTILIGWANHVKAQII